MENKELNIAEILKDKPKGIKLWSDIFGEVKFQIVTYKGEGSKLLAFPIRIIATDNSLPLALTETGRYSMFKGALPCIVPSKEMRDWEKFAWKKGDVLKAGVDNLCIFDSWESDNYTEFHAKFATPHYSGETFETKVWTKETNEDIIKQYISKIEEIKGGKLNLSTLEIKKRPEFKNGDILTFCGFIFIFKNMHDSLVYSHVSCDTDYKDCIRLNADKPFASNSFIADFKYATEEEKQQLFDALAKKGKQWDAEKKQIVDLPKEEKKCEFKPFDKVLVRDASTGCWRSAFFVCFDKDSGIKGNYIALTLIGGHSNHFHQCIPYTEETKHLLDTTDDWKGGE